MKITRSPRIVMKYPFSFILCLVLGVSQRAFCQRYQYFDEDPRQEIRVGYGATSFINMTEGVHAGEDGYDSRPISRASGVFSVVYQLSLSHRFTVGLGAGYEKAAGDLRIFLESTNGPPITRMVGSYKRQVFSIVPEGRFYYYRPSGGIVTTYGYLAVGASFLNDVDTYSPDYYNSQYYNGVNQLHTGRQTQRDSTEATFQFCPIGISVGRTVGAYLELGVGYKGLVHGGLCIKL